MSYQFFTDYVVTGAEEHVEEIYRALVRLRGGGDSLRRDVGGRMCLGALTKELGGDPAALRQDGIVFGFRLMDKHRLDLAIENCWGEPVDVRRFLEGHFRGLKIYYFEDGREEDVLNCNDLQRRYFKTVAVVDSEGVSLPDEGYFDSMEDAAAAVGRLAGRPVEASPEAIRQALEWYETENPDAWFSFHEVNYVSD